MICRGGDLEGRFWVERVLIGKVEIIIGDLQGTLRDINRGENSYEMRCRKRLAKYSFSCLQKAIDFGFGALTR